VKVIERVFAYRIVEHLMILANSVIAEYLFKSDALAIYRSMKSLPGKSLWS